MANTSNTSGILSAPKTTKPITHEDIQEEIRRRAYELYELRGRENGHDLEDWLQAEFELVSPRLMLELGAEGVKPVAA